MARAVARLDRRQELALLPQDDAEAEPFLAALPEDERYETWQLVAPDGSLAGRGTGLAELIEALTLTRPLARPVRVVPAPVLERFYRVVAANRSRLGRLAPDGPAPRRFP